MTITISSQTETLLKEQAHRLGLDADAVADSLLQSALQEATQDFEEACVAVSEALAGDPADDLSLEDYRAQFDAERQARRHERDAVRHQAAA